MSARPLTEASFSSKLRKIKNNQLVEQNYLINCMFISIYNHALSYMSAKLAKQFTIQLATELKPKIIKILEK